MGLDLKAIHLSNPMFCPELPWGGGWVALRGTFTWNTEAGDRARNDIRCGSCFWAAVFISYNSPT